MRQPCPSAGEPASKLKSRFSGSLNNGSSPKELLCSGNPAACQKNGSNQP
ncbi:MAG: hypothetical protein K9M99_11165 [Candidatus Cloacimonetes bacterium]|nr:hypothetical protein [Candidatus Cloacimonadota bacterium]